MEIKSTINPKLDILRRPWNRAWELKKRNGPMVRALDSGASGPDSSPVRGHCVVFLGTRRHLTLSRCLLQPRCINGKLQIVGENLPNCGGVTDDGLASSPEEVEILLNVSYNRNEDKLR